MRTKVKITKRQIKEDKFMNFMLRTKDQVMGNWQVLLISAAIVILVIVATVYFVNRQSTRSVEAADRLNKAILELRRQNYQPAILELGSIVDDYSGRVAGLAQFNLANAHFESKNYDEAIANYQKFIDKFHTDDLMTASAIAGIASSMECKQDFAGAAEKYYEAIKHYPGSPSAPDYYLGAVRCYIQGGNKDKANLMLGELKEKFPGTATERSAVRLAARLETQ